MSELMSEFMSEFTHQNDASHRPWKTDAVAELRLWRADACNHTEVLILQHVNVQQEWLGERPIIMAEIVHARMTFCVLGEKQARDAGCLIKAHSRGRVISSAGMGWLQRAVTSVGLSSCPT